MELFRSPQKHRRVTNPIRLLFDESAIGKPAVVHFSRFVEIDRTEHKPEIKHLFDFAKPDEWDENWIPRMVQGGWIVIAGDRGKRGGLSKGEKLLRVCVNNGVSHVLFSRRVGSRNTFEKLLSIVSVWHEILAVSNYPKGSRFMLEPVGSDHHLRGRGRLIHRVILPPENPQGPQTQRPLIDPD